MGTCMMLSFAYCNMWCRILMQDEDDWVMLSYVIEPDWESQLEYYKQEGWRSFDASEH